MTTVVLSDRQRQVLDGRAQGLAYKQIADRLSIGLGTVKTHLRTAFDKLQANSSIEAIRNLQALECDHCPHKFAGRINIKVRL